MTRLFLLDGASAHDAAVQRWLASAPGALGDLARTWFAEFRRAGPDVQEVMHDKCPTACVRGAALGYVAVFTHHVNVGFFQGATLPDPTGMLEGTGKAMRHVKLRPGTPVDAVALRALIAAAYRGPWPDPHDVHTPHP